MFEQLKKSLTYRAILTDTLPYEVPVIFSNDRLHAGLSAHPPQVIAALLERIAQRDPAYSIPYNYGIIKNRDRRTVLSIVHPLMQRQMAKFYELHAMGMLAHCSRGDFSLRRPVALASPFASEVSIEDDGARSGIPQLLAQADEPDPSHMTSYFVYGKYNLLGKFVSSREYIRLEERHAFMRTLDISKCFYNIYTHSITWAVKSKKFSKIHRESYSFESAFDKLMQRANYNETNGIVVGPEISRIFAEIIFQDIDDCVKSDMAKAGYTHGRHYDVRRYVDDYFIFTGSADLADRIERCLRAHLERYKLYANDKKVGTHLRPFVSPLSIAREHVSALLRDVSASLVSMHSNRSEDNANDASGPLNQHNVREARSIRAKLNQIRLIVAEYEIQFANLSGWLLSRLRRLILRCIKIMSDEGDHSVREPYAAVLISALEASLYICAVDLRVRTTYSLCQLVQAIKKAESVMTQEQCDLVTHLISDSLANLIRRQTPVDEEAFEDSIELYNLLICGAHFLGEEFLTSTTFKDCVARLMQEARPSYFLFTCLAFCMRQRAAEYGVEIAILADRARQRVLASGVDIWRDTEEYLIAIDYLSLPEVSGADKQSLFKKLFGSEPSHANLAKLGTYTGFSDWTGLSVEHQLRRKALRPVYAWT